MGSQQEGDGMSLSGAHRAAFRREVPQEDRVWSIRDERGFPAPKDPAGNRALPFWSKPSRVTRVIDQVPVYGRFDIVEIRLDDWLDRWLPWLQRDGLLVGVNWSGSRATGYDMSATQVGDWFSR
jgi:uncharacterized protein DUF2750